MNAKAPRPRPKVLRPASPSPPPPPRRAGLDDIHADFEFRCKRCGRCCGLTPFTRSDYKRIRRKAEKLRVAFVKQVVEGHTIYLSKRIVDAVQRAGGIDNVNMKDIVCPFLEYDTDKRASCVIYDDRPEICRMFGTEGWRGVMFCCPYQNIGNQRG